MNKEALELVEKSIRLNTLRLEKEAIGWEDVKAVGSAINTMNPVGMVSKPIERLGRNALTPNAIADEFSPSFAQRAIAGEGPARAANVAKHWAGGIFGGDPGKFMGDKIDGWMTSLSKTLGGSGLNMNNFIKQPLPSTRTMTSDSGKSFATPTANKAVAPTPTIKAANELLRNHRK